MQLVKLQPGNRRDSEDGHSRVPTRSDRPGPRPGFSGPRNQHSLRVSVWIWIVDFSAGFPQPSQMESPKRSTSAAIILGIRMWETVDTCVIHTPCSLSDKAPQRACPYPTVACHLALDNNGCRRPCCRRTNPEQNGLGRQNISLSSPLGRRPQNEHDSISIPKLGCS